MNFKTNYRKGTALIVVALLFFSFKPSYWEFDKKTSKTVYSSIATVFKSPNCSVTALDDIFYSVSRDDTVIGYLAVTNAPSKFLTFDYYVLFDDKAEILKVDILHYRENWGAEICSRQWLTQFIGVETENTQLYHSKIDAISGATISVDNLKHDLLGTCQALKLKL